MSSRRKSVWRVMSRNTASASVLYSVTGTPVQRNVAAEPSKARTASIASSCMRFLLGCKRAHGVRETPRTRFDVVLAQQAAADQEHRVRTEHGMHLREPRDAHATCRNRHRGAQGPPGVARGARDRDTHGGRVAEATARIREDRRVSAEESK